MPSSPAPASNPNGADRLRGRLMAVSLGALLDRVRGARDVLPHLAALKRGLQTSGPSAVDNASEQALAKICSQLGSLPLPDEDKSLHDLLDRVSAALESRRAERHNMPFDIERTVVIEEISHSDFMAVARGEAQTVRDDGRGLDDVPR